MVPVASDLLNRSKDRYMRRLGFEPRKALSHYGLNVVRLTTPASPRNKKEKCSYKNVLILVLHNKRKLNKHRFLHK